MIGLGGNSTLGIGVLIELKDNFTSTSKRVNNELERMHARARAIMRDNLQDIGKVGMGMMAAGAAVTLGLNATVNAASKFEHTMTKVKALGQLDGGQTKMLGNLAKNLSKKYGIMPNEIAGGILELVKRGVSGNDIPKALEAQLMTAIGADERLEGEGGVAARMMDMAMAWGFHANQMSEIGDIMAKGTQLTSMGFLDMAEAMKYSQDVLKNLNLSFGESVAMIGLLSNAGIKGSMAGTSLNNMYTQLTIAITGASKKKNAALKAMGLSPEDFIKANGDMLELIPTLKKLDAALKPFGGVARQGLMNDIFGIRGKRGVNPLLDALAEDPNAPVAYKTDPMTGRKIAIDPKTGDQRLGLTLKKLLEELAESDGTNKEIFDQISETFAQRKKVFQANWEVFKINVGTALLPALSGFLKALTPMLNLVAEFAETKVGKTLIALVAAGGLVSLLFGGFLVAISRIGLGFLGWKSTLDNIRMTMAWVMGGMKGNMVATMPGQNVNSAGSVYDKNGVLIRNAAIANMAGNMSQTAAMYRAGRGGVLTRIGRGKASVAGLARLAGRGGGMLGRIFAGIVRVGGPIINIFGKLWSILGPVVGLFGRLIPIIGWIWTAYSIISAIWGDDEDMNPINSGKSEPGVDYLPKYDSEMNENRFNRRTQYQSPETSFRDPFYVPPANNNINMPVPKVQVDVHPGQLNVYQDGELAISEKMRWKAQQNAADEGFNV